MKLEVTTNFKSFEAANMILKQGIDAFRENKAAMEHFGITEKELNSASLFRMQVLNAFKKLSKHKQTT